MPLRTWKHATRMGIAPRPCVQGDEPLLANLYCSIRAEEFELVAWPREQKSAFLAMQARFQLAGYTRNYPDAERWVIEREGSFAGRLFLHQRETTQHVLDIALLPAFRNKGLGGALLADVIEAAARVEKSVTLQVASFNPAARLYRRMGFESVEEQAPFVLMRRQWTVDGSSEQPA